jgi:hypothetical protein
MAVLAYDHLPVSWHLPVNSRDSADLLALLSFYLDSCWQKSQLWPEACANQGGTHVTNHCF